MHRHRQIFEVLLYILYIHALFSPDKCIPTFRLVRIHCILLVSDTRPVSHTLPVSFNFLYICTYILYICALFMCKYVVLSKDTLCMYWV